MMIDPWSIFWSRIATPRNAFLFGVVFGTGMTIGILYVVSR